ncbi:MAG: hypothetical protein QOH88_1130 [Verrucomicrobiota bacterium]|jgi:hypothetical protein
MLPSRSGRAGLSGAPFAFLLLAFLSCVALAADKGAKPEPTAKAQKKERPKAQEGVTSVPIPAGHDARGLVLPDFDALGNLRGKLEAGITRRLDDERVEFQQVKFTTFTVEKQTEMEIVMNSSIFNLKTQVLNSLERTTVKRADFEIAGDKMQFEMLTRKGTLTGNVKMVVHGKTHAAGNEGE